MFNAPRKSVGSLAILTVLAGERCSHDKSLTSCSETSKSPGQSNSDVSSCCFAHERRNTHLQTARHAQLSQDIHISYYIYIYVYLHTNRDFY